MLAEARNKVGILKRALFSRLNRYQVNEQITILQAESGTEFLIPSTVKEYKQDLRKAQKQIKDIARESVKHRQEGRLKRLTKLDLSSDNTSKTKAAIERKIQKAEDISRMFRKISFMRGNKSKTGITRLDVPIDPLQDPKQCEDWKTLEIPSEIDTHLRNRNQKHFGQASGPFTQPPLSQQIDFTASTETADAILEGTYDSSDLDEITQLLLSKLKREDAHKEPIPLLLSDEELVGKLRTGRKAPQHLHPTYIWDIGTHSSRDTTIAMIRTRKNTKNLTENRNKSDDYDYN